MEPITGKTVKVVSGSSIALSAISIVCAIGFLYAVISVFQLQISNNIVNWFIMAIIGISTYYLAFSILNWAFLKTKKKSASTAP